MLKFLCAHPDADFVSPYDHPDCYRLHLHQSPTELRLFEEHHWRTAASACLTFITRRTTLAKYERVFRTYARRNDDCAMWLSLTKQRLLNPVAMLRYFARREFHRKLVKAWLFCWPQVLFGRTARLWVPIPGVATHLSAGLFSPGTDWLVFMREEADRAKASEIFTLSKPHGNAR